MNKELLANKEPEHAHAQFLSPESSPLRKIVAVASIAAGSQFCWALQFSLLTPYVQLLGIPHTWASFIWLCGPISGILVQPIVGYHSDRCTSRFGRRRPFIAAGAAAVAVAVFLIGYAADLGHLSGDEIGKTPKTRAIIIFVVGFWILNVANNMLQGPCRALLADLSGSDQENTRTAYALFSFFMAIGSVLGYAAGSYGEMYKMLPFTETEACDVDCANLKTCFFIAIALMSTLTIIALSYTKEKPWSLGSMKAVNGKKPYFSEFHVALKSIKKPTRILLLVTLLNSTALFPYLLYDTDWMGREVYGGDSSGSSVQVKLYTSGVCTGTVGLMLGAVVSGMTSLSTESMARKVGQVKRLWAIGNFVLAVCMLSTILITKLGELNREYAVVNNITSAFPSPPSGSIKAAALALFAAMGVPQAVLFTIPFALASIFSNESGSGQVVSLISGPFDALFGGGNLPAFVVGVVAATASGILALTVLPPPPPDAPTGVIIVGFS